LRERRCRDGDAIGAHSPKSAARSVGAMRLGTLCEELEESGRGSDIGTFRGKTTLFDPTLAATSERVQLHL
jgi:HPt (histidine-containing phosphotransfer) domain-containing protein